MLQNPIKIYIEINFPQPYLFLCVYIFIRAPWHEVGEGGGKGVRCSEGNIMKNYLIKYRFADRSTSTNASRRERTREGKRGRLLFNWNFVIIWMISYKFNIFTSTLFLFARSFFMSEPAAAECEQRSFTLNFKLTSNSCINAAKRAQQLKF